MNAFDLLLILLVLATVASIVAAVAALFVGRRIIAFRTLTVIVAIWVFYLAIGTAIAIKTPQHIMSIGEDRCFDELCFAVTGWNRTPSTNAGKSFYLVQVRVSNRSRGRAQREIGRTGVLIDRSGRVYEMSRLAMQDIASVNGVPYPGLDSMVAPGRSLNTKVAFELPESVQYPGFGLGSSVVINPARIVICDEEHFWHWPTVVPLH